MPEVLPGRFMRFVPPGGRAMIERYMEPTAPRALTPVRRGPPAGRKKRSSIFRERRRERLGPVMDENTAIGREIEKQLGYPVMLSATGPEKAPKFKVVPLPGLQPRDVLRYESRGRFLFPVVRPTRRRRREAPLPGTPTLGDLEYDEIDYYALSGFLDVIKGVMPQVKSLAKKIVHPISTIRTIRARRAVRRGVTELQAKGVSPLKGTITTNSGKNIIGDLLTLENLAKAKAMLPGADMQDTYQELVDNGQVVEAADMVEEVNPGYFGGKPKTPGWILPAVLIGGLYFAYTKKII